jgi:hypothetical protein
LPKGNTNDWHTEGTFPYYAPDGSCQYYGYATYSTQVINVNTSDFYVLTGLFDYDYQGFAVISIYTAFDPSLPCNNNVAGFYSFQRSAPHLYIPVWLQNGTYIVVVTSIDLYWNGIYVWHLDPVSWWGTTTSNSNYWKYILPTTTQTCSSGSNSTAYSSYSWTQQVRIPFVP